MKFMDPNSDLEELNVLRRLPNVQLGPLNVSAISVATNIYRAGQCLKLKMEREKLSKYDLSWTAFSILYDLWICTSLETRQLAASSGITTATVSNVIKTLENKALCMREVDKKDRRLVNVTITEKGIRIMQDLYPDFHQGEVEIVKELSGEEQETLAKLLRKVIKGMQLSTK
ncbi:MarR family winged helix-turn-helix transcriptional regulator [Pelosinus propionicus]|uniref:DNA-binding transcriptional regulator, MarR family n=1 Tax=Pelosinus propionicus DSM 13327 TaxID=1123291 RepID=A0A1I4IA21_9FIRM|nr:MarR family transcriptional regulator [Pelosinus propionicus]SFL50611.1 DNA-binding transcriptional regulator, MarR family [Pelosinus propionicus DSM 13327]